MTRIASSGPWWAGTIRRVSFVLGLASCALAPSTTVLAADLSGAARVIDGDTIQIGPTHIRLWGIDAVEHAQTCQNKTAQVYACGQMAAAYLVALISGQPVSCVPTGLDRYGRTVAICSTARGELNGGMVSAGWAIDWPKYSRGRYSAEQRVAQQGGLGIWAGPFELPEQWRAEHHHTPVGQPTSLVPWSR